MSDGARAGTAAARKYVPSSATAIPTEQMRRYFHVASRKVMAVIVDERRACQRCGLDGHPQETEMLAGGDEGHGGEENEEARGEHGPRCVVEEEALLRVRPRGAAFPTEKAHRGK